MFNPLLDRRGRLRNGPWVLLFFVVLAAMVIPAQVWSVAHSSAVPVWIQAAMVLVATLVCTTLRRERPASALGRLRTAPREIAWGIAGGVMLWLFTAFVLWITRSVHWSFDAGANALLLPALLGCAATAVAEELVFRGFVFQRLVDGLGAWPAQVLIGAYFVLNHWNNPGMAGATRVIATINIFAASLLFGLCYLRTRGLALPIALHFALNATQGVLLGFGVSGNASTGVLTPHLSGSTLWTGGAFGLEASVPGTVVIVLAALAVANVRSRRGLHRGSLELRPA